MRLIKEPLTHIFKSSLKKGVFTEKLKSTKISSRFKTGEKELLTNYRPILLLPRFFYRLEKVMHNVFYSYLNQNVVLYNR